MTACGRGARERRGRHARPCLTGALGVALLLLSGTGAGAVPVQLSWTNVGTITLTVPNSAFTAGAGTLTFSGDTTFYLTITDPITPGRLIEVSVPATITLHNGVCAETAALTLTELNGADPATLTGSPSPGLTYALKLHASISKQFGPGDVAGSYSGTIPVTFRVY